MALYESLSEADPKTRDRLERLLQDDEELVLVLLNRDPLVRWLDSLGVQPLVILARKFDGKERVALTDQRVVEFQVGALRDVDDVQLDTISTVDFEFAAHSEIELSGSGFEKELTARNADEGEQFADEIRGQLTA
jgi:hypothetical protein